MNKNKITLKLFDEKFHLTFQGDVNLIEQSFEQLKSNAIKMKSTFPNMTINQILFTIALNSISEKINISDFENFSKKDNELAECKSSLERIEYFLQSIISSIEIETI